jgi:DNA repair protein RadC
VFAAILLDTQHRIIRFHEFFFGSIDCATVHPRIIAQKVLSENAAAIILVHNHPSGDPSASEADKIITKKITSALQLIDVRVLDHLVIGHKKCTSFAENGWI